MKVLLYRDSKKRFTNYEEVYYHNLKNYIEKINGDEVVNYLESEFQIAHFIGVSNKEKIAKLKKDKNVPIIISYTILKVAKKDYNNPSEIKIPVEDVKTLNLATLVLSFSQADKMILISNGVTTAIKVIRPGTKEGKFYTMNQVEVNAFSQYASLNKNDKYFVSSVQYKSYKDIAFLIEIAKAFKDMKIFVLTSKPKWYGIPLKARKMIKKAPINIKFKQIQDEDIYKSCLLGAKLFICPSESPSAPIIIFDAMVTKTPIFALYSPTVNDILLDHINAYVAFNEEQMINNIQSFIDGKLPSLENEAYEEAKAESYEKIAKKIKDVYNSLL